MMRLSAVANLHAMLKLFPRQTTNDSPSERIIALSTATLKNRVYGFTDVFQFGTTRDLFEYWIPTVDSKRNSLVLTNPSTIIIGTPIVYEIFLCARYLERLGVTLNFTLEQWWESFKGYFVVVNNSMLDAFWQKYDYVFEYRYTHSYTERGPIALDHFDWLQLMTVPKVNWDYTGFQETWTHEKITGSPRFGGISQISLQVDIRDAEIQNARIIN